MRVAPWSIELSLAQTRSTALAGAGCLRGDARVVQEGVLAEEGRDVLVAREALEIEDVVGGAWIDLDDVNDETGSDHAVSSAWERSNSSLVD